MRPSRSSKVPMTGSSMRLPGATKTSTRSVRTTSPDPTMLRIWNSTASTPPMNPSMKVRMASGPVTGSRGMLWYTASSVKAPTMASRSPSAQAAQKRRTTSTGASGASMARTLGRRGGQALDDLDARQGEQERRRRQELAGPAAAAEHDPLPTEHGGVHPERHVLGQADRGHAAEGHAGEREGGVGAGERGLAGAEQPPHGPVDVEPGGGQQDAGRVARRVGLAHHHDGVGRVLHGVAVGLAEGRGVGQ